MEYPLWFQDEKMAGSTEGFIWNNGKGYIFRAGYKPPTRKDLFYLLFILMKAQEADRPELISLTRAEVIKGCGFPKKKQEYDRLEDSLRRWQYTGVEFEGIFYDNKKYLSLNFGIIDSWWIEKKTKKLWIRLNPEFYVYEKNSRFCEFIDFQKLKKLPDPLSTRLYEILKKSLSGQKQWQIDSIKLAQKIPMNEQYPSDINPKIQTAVKRIAKRTDFNVGIDIKKIRRGKTTLIFTLKSATLRQMPLFPNLPDSKTKRPQPGEWVYIQGRSYQVAKDRSVLTNDYGHFSEKTIIQGFDDGTITRAKN